MSNLALNWAVRLRVGAIQKVVLLVLANRADKRHRCWPSMATIAAETELSESSVHAAVRKLKGAGLLSVEEGGGRARPSTYTLKVGADIATKGAPHAGKAAPERVHVASKRVHVTPERVQESDGKGAPHAPEPLREPKEEPKEEPSSRAPARARTDAAPPRSTDRGFRLPAEWQPTPADRDFAHQQGLDPDTVAAEFRDYWAGVPGWRGMRTDWSGAYRNRCRELASRRPDPQRAFLLPVAGRRPQRTWAERLADAAGVDLERVA